jgi:MOSC domain-containing protein YiiM
VTTRGVDLLGLPRGAGLRLGPDAVVEITGLRNPCVQIDGLEAGLMRRLVARDDDGRVVRKAGVMAVVLAGGRVAPGDEIAIELPEGEHEALQPV